MITLQDNVRCVDHREDFYRTERETASYYESRDREDRDLDRNY